MTISVLIAEDQAFLRNAYLRDLENTPGIEIVAAVGDGLAAIESAKRLKPDVALLDIKMPRLNGIQVAEQLRRFLPQLGIVILSNYNQRQYVEAFLSQGTAGKAYLLKTTLNETEELVRAIRVVAEGGAILSPEILTELTNIAAASPTAQLNHLTRRELEVLRSIAEGYTNVSIARQLSISERTVESHVNNIFAKLNLTSDVTHNPRVMAVRLFMQAGQ